MTLNNVQLHNAVLNKDVPTQTLMSQSSSAANVISAFQPRATQGERAAQNPQQTTMFASMTQAYKDSYDKFIKESSNNSILNFKQMDKLERFLEEDSWIKEKQRQQDAENAQHSFELLA